MTTDYFHQPADDTVIVTAESAEAIHFTFVHTRSGDDVMGLVVDDATIGPFCVVLTPEQAYTVSDGLLNMIKRRDILRAQFKKENPNV